MLAAFNGFRVRLQAVPDLFEQLGHRPRGHPMPGGGQLGGQLRRRFRRPPQRRLRIAARDRIHQRIQRREQLGVGRRLRRAARPRAAHPPRYRLVVVQLAHPLRDRVRVRTPGRGHRLDPTRTQHPRLRAQQQPPRPLVQMRPDQRQPRRDRIGIHTRQRHTTTLAKPTRQTYLITARVLFATAEVRCRSRADRREDPGPWTEFDHRGPRVRADWTLREATQLQPPHDRSASDALIVDLDVTASRIAHLPGAINGPTLSAGFDWCVRTR